MFLAVSGDGRLTRHHATPPKLTRTPRFDVYNSFSPYLSPFHDASDGIALHAEKDETVRQPKQ